MTTALFLGAGASVPYGMPTTEDLRNKINSLSPEFPRRDLLDAGTFPDIEHVLFVLDEIAKFARSRAGRLYTVHDAGKFTTGQLRNMADVFDDEEVKSGVFEVYARRSKESREIIEGLITSSYRWDPSYNLAAEKILRPLFEMGRSKEGHVTVFTTNYDIAIETYCGSTNRHIERIDGFRFHQARGALVWNDGKFEPTDEKSPTKVFLYKLHGSMNWHKGDVDGKASIVQSPETNASEDRSRDMYIRPSLDVKEEATQSEPYATLVRTFDEALPTFDSCAVIGYSFRDKHISDKLIAFAKEGKVLIALGPHAAADFWKNALCRKLDYDKQAEWENVEVCSMKFATRRGQGYFYAIHKELAEETAESMASLIKSLIAERAPAYPMGTIVDP